MLFHTRNPKSAPAATLAREQKRDARVHLGEEIVAGAQKRPMVRRLTAQGVLSWPSYCYGLIICIVITTFDRLVFSPLAAFPGPKLAALTNWYEFYYDVILQGQFTFKIQELHKKYGLIIRITSTELHIDDPDFYEQLYNRARKRDKYFYFSGRFSYASDSFSTTDHERYRLRRKAMSPMFSVKKIEDFQPVILAKVEKFCRKVVRYQDRQVLPLSRALTALTIDIITEYAFARSYDHLDSPDFKDTFYKALVAIYTVSYFALHFSWVFPVLDPEILLVVGMRKDLAGQVKEIRDGLNDAYKHVDHPTIFHELLNSDLLKEEKSDAPAGHVTTSWALTVASFHIKLAHKLKQLPYLNSYVHEGIRLAHSIITRDPRLAPDTAIKYRDWVIPPDTPIDNPGLERYFVPFGKGSRACVGINLAQAELYITLAVIFTRFTFDLHETDLSDVQMKHVYLVPYPKWDSKGVRVKVKGN
ncbi:cytochrome P450 family protein [Cadophora sp. MPI-SDFR-AT-0126]|nr:cytochrome P450 family protein [Leotiomycetes sp. MPI-SDFR-AT-0126]